MVEMTTQKEFNAKPEIKGLPKAIQGKLSSFIFKEIPKVPFFKPDGKPKKEWIMYYGEAWDAARNAARDAVWDAARDAIRNAARDAARDAVWDATWDAACNATRNTTRDAAWNAAWNAAWDAALFSYFILTSDLKFKDREKHLKHVKSRWEVWQKGYGLLCDVDGVLYVYCKGSPKPSKPLTDKEAREKLAAFEKRIAELEKTAQENADKISKIKAILA